MAYNASQRKGPIVYDLNESRFSVKARGYEFRFSSLAHKEKFVKLMKEKVEWLNDSMTRRFHIPCRFDELALFQLYMHVEGRGFLVYDSHDEVWYHKPEEVKFFTLTAQVVG